MKTNKARKGGQAVQQNQQLDPGTGSKRTQSIKSEQADEWMEAHSHGDIVTSRGTCIGYKIIADGNVEFYEE